MPKPIHPADAADRAAIATATGFIASIFLGTGQYDKIAKPTLTEAREAATQLEAAHPNGRKAMIYASLPNDRHVLVPADYRAEKPAIVQAIDAAIVRIAGGAADQLSNQSPSKEKTMSTKTFGKRFNAQRNAKSVLGRNAKEGVDFTTEKNDAGEWSWKTIYTKPKASDVSNISLSELNMAGGNQPKSAAAKAKAPTKTARPKKYAKPATGKRAAIEAAAAEGKLPPAPDFSAPTHERFRAKLKEVVDLVKAGDVKGLKAFKINPISTSPKAIDRYRTLAIVALEARR